MSRNQEMNDCSIHHISGTVVAGRGHIDNAITIIYNNTSNIEWDVISSEYKNAMKRIGGEEYRIFSKEYKKLETALKTRDEHKLKKVAINIGRTGINILKDASANVLAGILLGYIGM